MDQQNKIYQKVLEHRRGCKQWTNGFCLDCFGGGLNKFNDDFGAESRRELGLPSMDEIIIMKMKSDALNDLIMEWPTPSKECLEILGIKEESK